MKRLRGDDGAYALLYAVMVVLLIGITSLVVDVGMLRNDRRQNRAAADSAAVAGSARLGLSGANPLEACWAAVHYARADLGLPSAGNAAACTTRFGAPFNVAAACTANVPITATTTLSSGRTIHVTWPVPDSSPLMQDPDHERWGGFDLPDQTISSQDGSSCLRVGVAITQDRNTPFAAVWGDIDATRGTVSHSVGMAAPDDGPGDIAAPLVILDEHTCNALTVTGGGSVTVRASTVVNGISTPGVIAVDSDGLAGLMPGITGEFPCTNSNRFTIRAPSAVNHIWAIDGTAGPAYISSYAMAVGNGAHAFDLAAIANCTPGKTASYATLQASPQAALCPVPQGGSRVGEEPWILRYNCDEAARACLQPNPNDPLPSPRDYVNQWVDYATDTGASSPRAVWGTLPSTNRVTGGGCNLGTTRTFTGPTYVDCDKFTVTNGGKASFMGPVIFRGDVDAAGGSNAGCILFNDNDFAHCSTPAAYVAPDSRTTPDGGNVYVGGGFVGNGNNPYAGALIVNQVFVYVQGRTNITTSEPVDWVAPYGEALPDAIDDECTPDDPTTTTLEPPDPACFDSMGLWAPSYASESPTQNNQLLGGVRLVVDGTFFMPKAYFRFGGQGANFQDRAQFVTRRLEIAGGGELSMVPDGSRSTKIPRGVGTLIR